MSAETETAPETVPEKTSRWEDFIDVFLSPSELFRRRAQDSWWVPMLVLAALSMIVYYSFMPVNRMVWEANMLNNPQMTAEQQAGAARMIPTFVALGGIIVPISMAIMVLIAAFFAWLGGKFGNFELPYKRALTITTYVGFITVVQQLITYVLFSFKVRANQDIDPIRDASFGVIRFLDIAGMNKAVVALLGRIDLFAFWQMAWFALAFMAACKAGKGGAWTAAAVVWLAAAIPMLLQAMATP